SDLPEARQRNTLKALAALERVGCLTDAEYRILNDTYRFLRKVEHRLQLLFDLQTHRLPDRPEELRKLELRMGYTRPREGVRAAGDGTVVLDPLDAFLRDYREKTTVNRQILNHLLHQTFNNQEGQPEPESDLILEPSPDPERLQAVLGKYHFRDVQGAYQNLTQ